MLLNFKEWLSSQAPSNIYDQWSSSFLSVGCMTIIRFAYIRPSTIHQLKWISTNPNTWIPNSFTYSFSMYGSPIKYEVWTLPPNPCLLTTYLQLQFIITKYSLTTNYCCIVHFQFYSVSGSKSIHLF